MPLIAPDYVILQKVLNLVFTFILTRSLNPHAAPGSSLGCFKYSLIANSRRMLRSRMSAIKVPANLPELVRAKFNTAKANGDVNFYPTQVAVLKLGPFPVCLRRPPQGCHYTTNPHNEYTTC